MDRYNNLQASLRKVNLSMASPNQRQLPSRVYFNTSQRKNQQQLFETQNQSVFMNAFPQKRVQKTDSNDQTLYYQEVTVQMRNQEQENKDTALFYRINQALNGMLHFEITDENNHQLLYVLDCNESDFLKIKKEQCLLVDYQTFPQKLIELLDLTIIAENESKLEGLQKQSPIIQFDQSPQSNFVCRFDLIGQQEGYFKIIETNQFKALTHLSLKFHAASDDVLKRYLSGRLAKERKHNTDLKNMNENLQENLSIKQEENKKLRTDLREISDDREKVIQEIIIEEKQKITELKEETVKREQMSIISKENEKKTLVTTYEKNVRELREKNDGLMSKNQELMELRLNLESMQRENVTKIKNYERENMVLQREHNTHKDEIISLRKQNVKLESTMTEYKVKTEILNKQLESKEELISQNNAFIDNNKDQKTLLEENLDEYKEKCNKLSRKLLLCTDEINNGNKLIERYEDDLKSQKNKIKLKNNMALKQEEKIKEHQQEVINQKELANDCIPLNIFMINLNKVKSEMNQKEHQLTNFQNEVQNLKTKLKESQSLLEQSNQMIQWLNKEKNEGMRTKQTSYVANKYATYRDPSIMQNVTFITDNYLLPLKTVFGKIKQENTFRKFNPDGFSTTNKENFGQRTFNNSGQKYQAKNEEQYTNTKMNLPEQQKEEFSMNEHDFQNMGLIKPIKFQAI